MDNYAMARTARTPEIEFNLETHHLAIRGESYPEDAIAFYEPVIELLKNYLAELQDGACHFEFEFIYFNSSSARAVMSILQLLEDAAENGTEVYIKWRYDEEDDTMQEMGEEFGEDLENVVFELAVSDG